MSSLLTVVILFSLPLVGCTAPASITFVDEGAEYSLPQTAEVLEEHGPDPDLLDVEDVARRRTASLAALRRHGEAGNEAADLITASFPAQTRGVPYYVERATVEGRSVLLVAEAIGPEGRPLTDRRVWVLDGDGAVLFSAVR